MLRVTSYGLRVLIFLFLFLLPSGWAKHWIVPNSLVNGVLVDYLMPDIWVQDLIAVVLIAQILLSRNWKFTSLKLKYLILRAKHVNITSVISGLFVLMSIFLSPIPLVSAINFFRFLLAVSVGLIIYKNKDLHKSALIGLSGAVIWTAFLAIGQFINQRTVIGWQFLGEPIFGPGSGGVKKLFLFGQQILAPMATFPHANVMGAFGLLSFLILPNKKPRFFQIAKYFSLILVCLSFSLPVWLITFYLLIRKFKCTIVYLNLGIVFVLFMIISYQFQITSYYRRWNLVKHSLTMIKNHPFFGVGWGGFVKQLPQSTFMQPVHNIFLLILSELGFVGASGLVLVVSKFFKGIKVEKYLLLTTCYLILFLFDHYFWTTTQGIYMLWVTVALF